MELSINGFNIGTLGSTMSIDATFEPFTYETISIIVIGDKSCHYSKDKRIPRKRKKAFKKEHGIDVMKFR